MSDYPEHDKLRAVAGESQAIGEFLEGGGYTLCKFRKAGDNGEPEFIWRPGDEQDSDPDQTDFVQGRARYNPAYDEWDDHLATVYGSVERILADYFKIDLAKIEAEKRAMLEQLQAGS